MKEIKTLYYCDPDKNTACGKTICIYNAGAERRTCYATTHKEFSVDGKAIPPHAIFNKGKYPDCARTLL